jgi:hypothetical protein
VLHGWLKGALLEQPDCPSRLFVSSTKWQNSERRKLFKKVTGKTDYNSVYLIKFMNSIMKRNKYG